MTIKAKLVILRHGQTTYNEQHLTSGQRDVPLTKKGEQQARDAGILLKGITFDKAYSSTLSRAFNTAAIVLKAAGQNLPVEQRKELIEQDSGDYTGRNHREDPELVNRVVFYDSRSPNGESMKDVVERVRKLLDADIMPRLERGENVIVSAHHVPVYAFEILQGVSAVPEKLDRNKKIPNATPIVYSYEDGKLISVSSITKSAKGNAPVPKKSRSATMTKGILVLVRHGQTEDNIKRLLTGQNDVPLTKAGEEQARAAGILIKDITFDKVFSSPLSRAFNTASLALEAAGQELPIEKRDELLEGDAGKFAGRSMDTDPEVKEFVRLYDVPSPGGESDKQLVARVQKLYEEELLPLLKQGKKLVVFSHSGTTRGFHVVMGLSFPTPADGTAWVRTPIPNAGPSVHEYEDGVRIKSYDLENPETAKAANRNADKNTKNSSHNHIGQLGTILDEYTLDPCMRENVYGEWHDKSEKMLRQMFVRFGVLYCVPLYRRLRAPVELEYGSRAF